MSTRACYGFKDRNSTYWVYVHHDGYPEGAADKFRRTLDSKLIWKLPRFEADEFAAGFVAANKTHDGSVRLTHGTEQHGDLAYTYLLWQENDKLMVSVGDGGANWYHTCPLSNLLTNPDNLAFVPPQHREEVRREREA